YCALISSQPPTSPLFPYTTLFRSCGLAISFAGAGIYDLVAAGYLTPRPVTFPEIPWMGIHPDLTGLVVQLTIVAVIFGAAVTTLDRKSTRLNSSHVEISYAVFCLK